MADVQLENGYVKLANELLDAFLRLRLTSYQTSIFFSIVRKTYGFNKREDQISLSQFEELTGIARRNVYRTVQELQSMNLITIRKESHMRVFYGVQKDHDKWLTVVKPENSLKPQLLSNQRSTVLSNDNKTVVKPENNKRHKRHITKDNIVQNLPDKETLSAFLLSIPAYQTLSSPLKEPLILFINKVRQGNKTKALAQSRAKKMLQSFCQIIDHYGADHTLTGINTVFAKEKREGFNYAGRDPLGYIRAVAKGERAKRAQVAAKQKAQQEQEAMQQAPGAGGLMGEIDNFLKG